VTKALPGTQWLEIPKAAGYRHENCASERVLSIEESSTAIGTFCVGSLNMCPQPLRKRCNVITHMLGEGVPYAVPNIMR